MSRLARYPFLTLGVVIFLVITALVAFRLSTGAKADTKKTRLITVDVVTPLRQDLDIRLGYTADISPNQVVNIFSRVDGYIAKLHVDKGDFVRANQLLVEMIIPTISMPSIKPKPTSQQQRRRSRNRMRWCATPS